MLWLVFTASSPPGWSCYLTGILPGSPDFFRSFNQVYLEHEALRFKEVYKHLESLKLEKKEEPSQQPHDVCVQCGGNRDPPQGCSQSRGSSEASYGSLGTLLRYPLVNSWKTCIRHIPMDTNLRAALGTNGEFMSVSWIGNIWGSTEQQMIAKWIGRENKCYSTR